MKRFWMVVVGACCAVLGMAGCTVQGTNSFLPQDASTAVAADQKQDASNPVVQPRKTMHAFRSEAELTAYLKELAVKQARTRANTMYKLAAPAPTAQASMADTVSVASESVTNVQHAGVDEGDIVKVHGDHLVVLRRGRLFTIAIGKGDLTPISSVDAFAPDINPAGTWYDEMLVSDDTVVVIGYSYERGGTEVGLFQIDKAGNLAYRSTYHLRSNDYYSSRNYASRLIGSKLIFYSPLYMYFNAEDPFQSFPAVRKWHKGAAAGEFHRIVSANHVYRPDAPMNAQYGEALHTVTICDLAHGNFDCNATSVIGPAGRVFYVSPHALYIWVTDWFTRGQKPREVAQLFRMPLDGSAPSAVSVSGSPVDQFSFLESEDGNLNVLVRADSAGDGMWRAEVAAGDVALMRIPISSFSDGSTAVPPSRYRPLPDPHGYTFQNRFVGDYLLYGTGSGWGYPRQAKNSSLFAVRYAGGDIHELLLDHGTDRIEALGSDAVIVGTDGRDLHFTSVRLGEWPAVVDDYARKDASQGELRSHGFFYKPDTKTTGMLGLPISRPSRPGYSHLFENSAAILFLKNDSLHFSEAGELAAQPERTRDDACRASCVDWYGNARPLFVHGRVIAMLGYELVEGSMERGQIQEMNRVSYAPGSEKVRKFKPEDVQAMQ
ncbi:MAG TPA: beta-propeller domain-containing protein [Candidatus Angelobacter sp.]|nr:beta-propeller domain-containing protein [Candidatus Angelobacter sp.]